MYGKVKFLLHSNFTEKIVRPNIYSSQNQWTKSLLVVTALSHHIKHLHRSVDNRNHHVITSLTLSIVEYCWGDNSLGLGFDNIILAIS
jgi:hypothetical protein